MTVVPRRFGAAPTVWSFEVGRPLEELAVEFLVARDLDDGFSQRALTTLTPDAVEAARVQ